MLSTPYTYAMLTIDHVAPVCSGGDSVDISNMVCACVLCNNLKKDYKAASKEEARLVIEEQRYQYVQKYVALRKHYRKNWLRKLFGF